MLMRERLVCWFDECDRDSLGLVGGKVSSLGELLKVGVGVPPGFAVTTHGFRQFFQKNHLTEAVRDQLSGLDARDADCLERVCATLRKTIEQAPVSLELEDAIAERYRRLSVLCNTPATPVAVRSSATAEDLPEASFAGQQDTYLWVRGVDDLIDRTRRCFASLFNARAVAYRARMGFPHEQVALSVGIQKMVNSQSAGVMFTLNPSNGDRSSIVINANFGFGESVVSGEVTPDEFLVDKVSMDLVRRVVSRKEVYYAVDRKTHTSKLFEIPAERQLVQSVLDEEVVTLASMGKRIEHHYGRPMDIEWAVDSDMTAGSNIFILQARPETVWASRQSQPQSDGPKSALDQILATVMTGRRTA